MATLNATRRNTAKNNEGAPAIASNPERQLRRSLMACMLWEDSFYEDGQSIAQRIASVVKQVKPHVCAELAIDARHKMKLRHAPLLLVREMARHEPHRKFVAATLESVIDRADELAEFMAIYWKDGKTPVAACVKKGLARAFRKFDEYALAKYDRAKAIRLRDVLFICHANPKDAEQALLWKKLIDNKLEVPDTWEVALSGGADKRETFERLIVERKLGALALLRNLRNMQQAGVTKSVVEGALTEMKTDRVLPFRFIAAARAVPQWESLIEPVMIRSLANAVKLPGRTVLLVDTSPSMQAAISSKSDLNRKDAANALAILLREICDDVTIVAFSQEVKAVPPRRGFALADAILNAVPSNGTLIGKAVASVTGTYDRLIVITDEESQDAVHEPDAGKPAYMLNVSTSKNGVGYGKWHRVDGWSESVIDYIRAFEVSP